MIQVNCHRDPPRLLWVLKFPPRLGIPELFDSLIQAIVLRKGDLDQENEMTKRDSIFLSPAPAWAAQADEEEARLSARNSSWSCCST